MDVQSAISPSHRVGVPSLRLAFAGDERLARLVGQGDEAAFRLLYERYHQPLYRYCRSLLRNDTDAQDALQSALTAAFAALTRSQRDAPIRPWLFRIAHNESISLLRRRRPEQDLSAVAEPAGTSLEDHVEERERLELLVSDLRELPERQRGALVMRELSGLSHEEIALALETSVSSAKQTIFEARKSLNEFAEGRAMACDEVRRMVSEADGRVLRSRRVRAHIRHCQGCAAFAAAIPARSAQLRVLAPPLPALAATGIIGRVLGGGSAHGGNGVGLLAGGAGKAVGTAVATKAVAVAVATTAAVTATLALRQPMPKVHAPSTGTVLSGGAAGAGRSVAGSSAARSAAGNGSAAAAKTARAAGARSQHRRVPRARRGAAAVAAAGAVPARTAGSSTQAPHGVNVHQGSAQGLRLHSGQGLGRGTGHGLGTSAGHRTGSSSSPGHSAGHAMGSSHSSARPSNPGGPGRGSSGSAGAGSGSAAGGGAQGAGQGTGAGTVSRPTPPPHPAPSPNTSTSANTTSGTSRAVSPSSATGQ